MKLFKKLLNLRLGKDPKSLKKHKSFKNKEKEEVVQTLLSQLISKAGLDLSFQIQNKGEKCIVEIKGKDQSLMIEKEGRLLSAFQLFVKRVLQHHGFFDFKDRVFLDCAGFRKKLDQDLMALVKKLKEVAIHRGAPVYLKALSPRDRKLVHQLISEDEKVKSTSIGDGIYKKIRISPVNGVKANAMKKVKKEKGKPKNFNEESFL